MDLSNHTEKNQGIVRGECSEFVVNTLTTANQRDASLSS